jgi:hypothetical protein
MPNPFLANTSNRTTGNLMGKWFDSNLDLSNLIKDPEQKISSEKIGRACLQDEVICLNDCNFYFNNILIFRGLIIKMNRNMS